MIFLTHIAFALLLAVMLGPSEQGLLLLVVGSLLPDIDTKTSFLGKRIGLRTPIVEHRKLFHSLFFMGVVSVFAAIMGAQWPYLALGMASHVLLDSLTKKGVQLLWPWPKMLGGPAKTGGVLDYALLGLCTILIVITY